jgi:octaprenyl-diphosphate synthase
MVKLEDIKKSIGPDLKALNKIIEDTLQSDCALMNSIVSKYLVTKGKQLRPILVLLSGRLFGGITDNVLYSGAAIEMLHNASLIHDDVIDRSKERHGAATINSVWDNHVAVLVGDFFVSGALACASKAQDFNIMKSLSRLGRDLSLGEINQFDTARSRNINENAYFEIIGRKTASLFTSCVEVGGLAAGAKPEQLTAIKRYADLLGLCFQIKDDTFDYYNDPAIGKPTGNDLREGKVTLPLIYALSKEDAEEHDEMNRLVHKEVLTTDEIERLIEFAKANGGIDYAYNEMKKLRDEAEQELEVYGDGDTIDSLKAIFNFVIEREI